MEILIQEGYLQVKRGSDTYVISDKTAQKLNYITSLSETLMGKGYKIHATNVGVELVKPPLEVAQAFGMPGEDKLVKIFRLRHINGVPICISINYLLQNIAGNISAKTLETTPLYKILREHHGVKFTSADEYIGAKAASKEEAKMLKVVEGAPLLTSRRITFSGGRVLEFVYSMIIPGDYEYCVHLVDKPS